jgi:argininosuccinate synthase
MSATSTPDSPRAPLRKIALAFSGGLDTSFCVVWLRERFPGAEVIAVTVDTGGFEPGELDRIARRAADLGASMHISIDARDAVYRDFVKFIVMGNVLRGGVYPLCVAAERVQQAIEVARVARELGCDAVSHGSTGAGNDQVRFDVALRTLLPGKEILTPIRDEHVSRTTSTEKLRAAGFAVEEKTRDFSINVSLWGTTIGGREIHDAWNWPPDEVWKLTRAPESCEAPVEIVLGFEQGEPVSLDGARLAGSDLIAKLNALAGARGVGRGVHLGDTILGIKGRIAFEAPAPIVLIRAHRELEKLVLTKWQQMWKEQVASFYGNQLHEGLYFDPVMRDMEAFLQSSQARVTGEVRVRLAGGTCEVRGVRSPRSLIASDIAKYGEGNSYWDGRDARGFSKLYGLQAAIAAWRGEK